MTGGEAGKEEEGGGNKSETTGVEINRGGRGHGTSVLINVYRQLLIACINFRELSGKLILKDINCRCYK